MANRRACIFATVKATLEKIGAPEFFGKTNLSVLREDLLHPQYGGNKWRKIKYNLLKAKEGRHDTLLTFGGQWSNHLHATAAACRDHGLRSIGIVRGEAPKSLTETLLFAKECGMQLHFVSRAEYDEKDEHHFSAWLHDTHGSFYRVPEGGANYLGVQGCTEILGAHTVEFEFIVCPAGTGTTAAGLLLSLQPRQKLLVFSALKGEDKLTENILRHVGWALGDPTYGEDYRSQLQVVTGFHFGGYAKHTPELLAFMKKLHVLMGLQTDHVYTGKMLFGLAEMAAQGLFPEGAKVLAIHTGGLQGLTGLGGLNPFS